MISPEDDKFEVKIGETVAGADLVVVPTPAGLYKIICRGEGAAPKLCDQTFTTLPFARRALAVYRQANAVKIERKERVKAIVEKHLSKEK